MPKDSQPDNKTSRMEKCNYQTPLTEEGHNHNPNINRLKEKEYLVSIIIPLETKKRAKLTLFNIIPYRHI